MLYRTRWDAKESESLKLYMHLFVNGVLTDADSIGGVAIYSVGSTTPQVTFSTPSKVATGTYMIQWNIPSSDPASPLYYPTFPGPGSYSDVWSNITIGSNTFTRTFNFVINPATFATNTSLATPLVFNFAIQNPTLSYGAKDYMRVQASETNNAMTPDVDTWPDGEIRIRRNQAIILNYTAMTHVATSNLYNYYVDTTGYTVGTYEAQVKFDIPASTTTTSASLVGTQNLSNGYSPLTGSEQWLRIEIDGVERAIEFPGTATPATITANGRLWTDPLFITDDSANNSLYVKVDGGNYQVINLVDGENRTLANIVDEINAVAPYNQAIITGGQVLTAGSNVNGLTFIMAFDAYGAETVTFADPNPVSLADIILEINAVIGPLGSNHGLASNDGSDHLRIESITTGATSKLIMGTGTANSFLGFADGASAMGADRLEGAYAEAIGGQLAILSDSTGSMATIEIGATTIGSSATDLLGLAAGVVYTGSDSTHGRIDGAKYGGLVSASFVEWEQAEILSGVWAATQALTGLSIDITYTNYSAGGTDFAPTTTTDTIVLPVNPAITLAQVVNAINAGLSIPGAVVASADTLDRLILSSVSYGNDARIIVADSGAPGGSAEINFVSGANDYGYSGNNRLWLRNQNDPAHPGGDQMVELNAGTFTPAQVTAAIQSSGVIGIDTSTYTDEWGNSQIYLQSQSTGVGSTVNAYAQTYPPATANTIWQAAETIGFDYGAYLMGLDVTGTVDMTALTNKDLYVVVDEGLDSEIVKYVQLLSTYANITALKTDINISTLMDSLNPEVYADVVNDKLILQSVPTSPYILMGTTVTSTITGPASCNINIDGRGAVTVTLNGAYGTTAAVIAAINLQIYSDRRYGVNSIYTACASLSGGCLKITSPRKGSVASVVMSGSDANWNAEFGDPSLGTASNRVLEPFATTTGNKDLSALTYPYTFAGGSRNLLIDIGANGSATSYNVNFGAGAYANPAAIVAAVDVLLNAGAGHRARATLTGGKYLTISTAAVDGAGLPTSLDADARIVMTLAGSTASPIVYKDLVIDEVSIHPSNLMWSIDSTIKFSTSAGAVSTVGEFIGFPEEEVATVGYGFGIDPAQAIAQGTGVTYPVDVYSYVNNLLQIGVNGGAFNQVKFEPSGNWTLMNLIDFINGQAQLTAITGPFPSTPYKMTVTTDVNDILRIRVDGDTLDRILTLPAGDYYLTQADGPTYLLGATGLGGSASTGAANWNHNGQAVNFDCDDFNGYFRIFSLARNSTSSRVEVRSSAIATGNIDIVSAPVVFGPGANFVVEIGAAGSPPDVYTIVSLVGNLTAAQILTELNDPAAGMKTGTYTATASLSGNFLCITTDANATGPDARIVIHWFGDAAPSPASDLIYDSGPLVANDIIYGSTMNAILGFLDAGEISDVGAISTTFYPQSTTVGDESFIAYLSAPIATGGQLQLWGSKVGTGGYSLVTSGRMIFDPPPSATTSRSLQIGNDGASPGDESYINTFIGFNAGGVGPDYGNFGITYTLSGTGGIIEAIITAYGGDEVADSAGGFLRLKSLTSGLSSTVEVLSTTSADILANFGLTASAVTGTETPHVSQTILSPWMQWSIAN